MERNKVEAEPRRRLDQGRPEEPSASAADSVGRLVGATRGRTQQERRSEAETRLLKAAREILAHKGWAGMTLADVGEAAGYSRGLAGHYFGSKAGLLQAITRQINNSLMEEISTRPTTPPGLETIVSFVETHLGRSDPRWTNTRIILVLLTETLLEGSENGAQMIDFNASMFLYLEDNVRVGIEKGEIEPSVSPPIAAEFIVGTLRGMMLQRLVKGSEVEAARLSRQLAALIRRSLAAPAAAKRGGLAKAAGSSRRRQA